MRSSHPEFGKKIQSGEFGLQTLTKKWRAFRNASFCHHFRIYNGVYFNIKLRDLIKEEVTLSMSSNWITVSGMLIIINFKLF